MTIKHEQPNHRCINTGNRTIGFCALNVSAMEELFNRNATGEEVKSQLREWIAADAATNPLIDADSEKGYRQGLLKATLSNNPFAIYCGLCLEPMVLISPEAEDSGIA